MKGEPGKKPFGIRSGWDIPAAIAAVLLYVNFLVFLVMLAAAMGLVLLYPAIWMATGILMVVGIIMHLITRSRTSKLWRRLLLGGIAANGLIVLFFFVILFLMTAAWG